MTQAQTTRDLAAEARIEQRLAQLRPAPPRDKIPGSPAALPDMRSCGRPACAASYRPR